MSKGISEEIKGRIEAIEGCNISDAAKQRYLVEQRSLRWLSTHWHINMRTAMRVLKDLGIATRKGSDAVKTQWLDAEQRRKDTAKRLAETNHRLAAEGKHVRQGKNKSNSELIRAIATKLRVSSSFRRREVIEKSRIAREATRQRRPERMSAVRQPLSEAESIIANYLAGKSITFAKRQIVGSYIVDFVIPSLNLIVDCQGRNRFPLSYKRHKALLNEGYRVVYCVNEFIKRGIFSNLDDYITRLKVSGTDPATTSAESVIFGACGNTPFGDDTNKFIINRFGVRSNYYTELTRTSNN